MTTSPSTDQPTRICQRTDVADNCGYTVITPFQISVPLRSHTYVEKEAKITTAMIRAHILGTLSSSFEPS